jgi:uncharacterized protein (DUF3820 family)
MQKKRLTPWRRKQFRRRPFSPSEPAIVAGKFTGRRLSDLSDGELNYFLRVDARYQTRPVIELPGPFVPSFPDLSQYWFAKYELEKRIVDPGIQTTH